MRILVLNGPNINLLGIREPGLYGSGSYADLVDFIQSAAQNLSIDVDLFQSNHEGELVERIQQALGVYDGIVINPAAYTHTSIAILDALKAIALPAVEVHLTDPTTREDFRHISYAGLACFASIRGHGFEGYGIALKTMKERLGTQGGLCPP